MKKILCFLMACMMLCSVALAEEETDPLAAEFLARTIDGDGAGTWITWSLEDLRQFQEVTGMEGTLLDEAPADWLIWLWTGRRTGRFWCCFVAVTLMGTMIV